MTSVAERNRRKKENQRRAEEMGLTLTETPKREGKCFADRIRQQPTDTDPQRVALSARARQAGWRDTADNRERARAQSMEGQVGLALHLGVTGQRERDGLWETYKALDAAEDRYARRILGKPRHAKTAKIEMEPQRMEARADDRPDIRSDDEKDRAAVTAWMTWQGYLGHLDAWQHTAIYDGILGRADLVSGAETTMAGKRFVASLLDLRAVETSRRKMG